MARGINKVILVGNLGSDPEVRYANNGNAITSINIATTESWKGRDSGEQKERTEWHRVVMFNRLAEIAGQHLKKGSQVYIEGKLQTRKWQDQSGQDRYTTEIVANEMQMLGSEGNDQSNQFRNNSPRRGPQQNPNNAPLSQSGRPSVAGGGHPQPNKDFDDDIPF